MLIRIVKLTIHPDKIKEFTSIYEAHMEEIKTEKAVKNLSYCKKKSAILM